MSNVKSDIMSLEERGQNAKNDISAGIPIAWGHMHKSRIKVSGNPQLTNLQVM